MRTEPSSEAVARESVPGALPPGSHLGRYQIIKRLAMGGMAELYLARQTGDGGYEKIVALKRVLPHLTEDVAFVRMFLNEAKLAAGLDHSNIVHVLDFGSERGEHFMAMEYVHGRNVQQILKAGAQHQGVPRDVALTIAHEVAAALHYAHERAGPDGRPLGLVHRDVSPSNVLVSFEGDVKLVDFGIAKATAHTRVTRSGAIKGKLAYMAPEQVRGEETDRRADVFALGVMTYELCTGRRCFTAPGEFALINRVAEARFEKPTSIDPDFPEALEAVIVRALSVDPEDRFESARSMQRALEAFATDHRQRISRLVLSEYLDMTFGQEAYPTTQMLPPATSNVAMPLPTEARTFSLATPGGRRRASLGLAATALVIGLAVGLGGPYLLSKPESTEANASPPTPSAPEPAQPAAAPGEPDAKAEPAEAATPDPEPEEELTIVVEDEPDEGDPATAAPQPRTKTKRKKRRNKGDKPTGKAPASSGPSVPAEYLPPSRR